MINFTELLRISIGCGVVLCSGVATAADAPASGRVVDAATKQPVPNAIVSLTWGLTSVSSSARAGHSVPSRLDAQEARTDNLGRFQFRSSISTSDLPEGTALDPSKQPELRIIAVGYQTYVGSSSAASSRGIKDAADAGAYVFELKPLGSGQAVTQLNCWYDDLNQEIQREQWVGGIPGALDATLERTSLLSTTCEAHAANGQAVDACRKLKSEAFGLTQMFDSAPVGVEQHLSSGGLPPDAVSPLVPERVEQDGTQTRTPIVTFVKPIPD